MYLQSLKGMQSSKLGLLKGYLFCQKCYICIKGLVVGPRGILGDPGVDSGGEGKSNGLGKNMARRKVKNDEKSPRGQCLTRPVQNGRRRSAF